jgi:beta-galactosidase
MKYHPLSQLLLTVVICFAGMAALADDFPIGQQTIVLSKSWKFSIDPGNNGLVAGWQKSSFNDQGWESINVPDNWDLHNEYANYRGKGWYRTRFLVPALQGRRAILAFGEVGNSYKVYFNDSLVASVLCGDFTQEFDVTSYCKQGAQNQFSVEVDNSLSWGAYWNWGGIRRAVSLQLRNAVYIERQEIIANPDLTKGTATIRTAVYVRNASTADKKIVLAQQLSKGSSAVASISQSFVAKAGTTSKFILEQFLPSEKVSLWHFDFPHLYTSQLDLKEGGKISYQHQDRFGIRKIELDGYQFKLNGESIRLAGYNWVADDRTTGSTLPEHRYKEDIDMMKEAGANLARLSHRPLPKDVMDYLDEKGFLVLAEFNNWPDYMNDRTSAAKGFATNFIQQNFNHPSIFGWSVGNENGNLKEYPEVNNYVASIIPFIKKNLDSSRLVTYVSHTADYQANDAAQFCDVLMINKYGGYEKAIDELKKRYPGKAVFMSEYGSHVDNLIYDTPDKTSFKSLMVDGIANKENLFGYSLWTFNDYRSAYQVPNPATTTPLHQNRQWGIIDNYRNKKRAYRQMQKFYAPVAAFKVRREKSEKEKLTLSVLIQPRAKMDVPSYILRGYMIRIRSSNQQTQAENTRERLLSDILPGSDSVQLSFQNLSANVDWYNVSLVSPTGYAVLDTTIHLQVPGKPAIVDFIKSANAARVVFEKDDRATEYILKYSLDSKVTSMPATIDHYAEIAGLAAEKDYKVWVVGKNDLGEGPASDIKQFMPHAGYAILPPVIWLAEAGDNCFFVAPSFQLSDVQYEVRFGTSLLNKNQWRTVTSSAFGMFRVGNLTNGTKYFFQIRKRSGYNAIMSEWSEVKEVVPGSRHYQKSENAPEKIDKSIEASQSGSMPLLFSADKNLKLSAIENWQDPNETFVRNGLPNFSKKIKVPNRKITVAFLGGSITKAHDQYRQQLMNCLQALNPKVEWIGVNAGVSGTGSDLGACRLQDQVLKYAPDLIFVEFAVNGGHFAAMEGLVRQARKMAPSADICFIYTISGEQYKQYADGGMPANIAALEKIADHYQIPSVHMGLRPAQLLREDKLVWKSKDSVAGKIVFSNDGVHPTKEGGDLYAAAVARGFQKILSYPSKPSVIIPAALYGNEWEKATMLDPLEFSTVSGNWKKLDIKTDKDLNAFAPWFPYLLHSATANSSICFNFKGTGFGFFDIGGPEAGQVDISVDGQPAQLIKPKNDRSWTLADTTVEKASNTINRFNDYCFGRYRGQFELVRLKDGIHKVCYTVSPKTVDKKSFSPKLNADDILLHPEKYAQQAFYLGKILVLGTPIKQK